MLVPAMKLAGAVTLALVVIQPGPAAAAAGPGVEPAVRVSVATKCAVARRQQVQEREPEQSTRRGVLGWLYRYTRNIDIERVGVSRLPGFLRSPLLGSLPARTQDCDPVRELEEATTCAIVSLDPGADESRTVTVPLPQMGVTTPSALVDRIHEDLAIGEWVSLRTNRDETLRFDRHKVRYVEAEACRKDA